MTTLETKADAEALINKEGIEYVSVRFTDLIGVQQHFTVPASEFLKDAFDEGMPFDGSSIEGFQAINESDMKLVPDIETAFVDPFRKHKTLNVAFSIEGMPFDGSSIEGFQAINESDMKLVPDIETAFVDPFRKHKTLNVAFSIVDPLTDEPYSRDPRAINESDMKLVPDIETAFVDPFRKHKTLNVAFSIVDPLTDEPYSRDPRQVAAKAESYLKSTGIADTASFAPEAEFFIFDKVRFGNDMRGSFYEVDSVEAPWNSGLDVEADGTPNIGFKNRVKRGYFPVPPLDDMRGSFYEVDSVEAPWNSGLDVEADGTPNIGFKNRVKRGYFPVPPLDHTQDLRDDMVAYLQKVGLILERAHHEVGGAGQQEINYRFNSLQHAGDDLMKYKYVIHETAALAGKAATFMPKPLAGDNGTGMHCHQSLWKDGKPLFYDEKNYGGLSDLARWYIGGLIKHSSAVLAFTNPSLNSYHRLVPGFEAPVNLVYSARNRSAAIRIPDVHAEAARGR